MASPLEDIDFLARSEHRVDALRRLREGPADRDDLTVATEASKATISRLLTEFEERINSVAVNPCGDFAPTDHRNRADFSASVVAFRTPADRTK